MSRRFLYFVVIVRIIVILDTENENDNDAIVLSIMLDSNPASNAEGSCDDFLDVGRRFDGTVVAIAIAIAIAAAVAVATHLLHSVELRCILAC